MWPSPKDPGDIGELALSCKNLTDPDGVLAKVPWTGPTLTAALRTPISLDNVIAIENHPRITAVPLDVHQALGRRLTEADWARVAAEVPRPDVRLVGTAVATPNCNDDSVAVLLANVAKTVPGSVYTALTSNETLDLPQWRGETILRRAKLASVATAVGVHPNPPNWALRVLIGKLRGIHEPGDAPKHRAAHQRLARIRMNLGLIHIDPTSAEFRAYRKVLIGQGVQGQALERWEERCGLVNWHNGLTGNPATDARYIINLAHSTSVPISPSRTPLRNVTGLDPATAWIARIAAEVPGAERELTTDIITQLGGPAACYALWLSVFEQREENPLLKQQTHSSRRRATARDTEVAWRALGAEAYLAHPALGDELAQMVTIGWSPLLRRICVDIAKDHTDEAVLRTAATSPGVLPILAERTDPAGRAAVGSAAINLDELKQHDAAGWLAEHAGDADAYAMSMILYPKFDGTHDELIATVNAVLA